MKFLLASFSVTASLVLFVVSLPRPTPHATRALPLIAVGNTKALLTPLPPAAGTAPASTGKVGTSTTNPSAPSSVTAAAPAPLAAHTAAPAGPPSLPKRLIIPAISLNVPIIPVGVNARGEMDVPDGTTDNVGWYKNGPVPGATGSAVLDAHVYAAFKNLQGVKVGNVIDVVDRNGANFHFIVNGWRTYPLARVPLDYLFGRYDGRYLNLITCAGNFDPTINTYDHRLIIYAVRTD